MSSNPLHTDTPVVEVRELCVSYGTDEDERRVLEGVDLHVEAGGLLCIVGGSGCGKSTLLKTIVGLVEPRSGTVRVLGQPLHELVEAEQAKLLQRVGVMFQYGALLNSLSVGENVALPLQMHTDLPADLIDDLVRTRLRLVGLDGTRDLLPTQLSGGMRKRAALARAMSLEPEVLFCDEPGAGLDPQTAAGIDRLLLSLNEQLGMSIVVVTHELLSIDRLDGDLIMLDEGSVAFAGTVSSARQADLPGLQRFFHPDTEIEVASS
ncbi:MAG: ATP-binding cassette domain-containing protein [Gemmatimonadetes bacterium]|nr:ATP-binding cassette domain-containing protein [Gemmatimonadota bacterium]MBT7859894.1 ATP-binding cassette domain-containing protein [Gemmatimonadota bacterium]